jgi:type II secretory pathway pseudopilin PulG
LLTVIAILAVLATLMLTAVASAKKKSRTALCTSNLHQLSLALNMYLDDFDKRPPALGDLVRNRHLPAPAVLRCPADKTGFWGALASMPDPQAIPDNVLGFNLPKPDASAAEVAPPLPFSYLHALGWSDTAWDRLLKSGPSAGLVACQLHGMGRPGPERPSIRDYEGLVLRGQKDGAVVRRQVFWRLPADRNQAAPPSAAELGVGAASTAPDAMLYPWQLFTDEPPAGAAP